MGFKVQMTLRYPWDPQSTLGSTMYVNLSSLTPVSGIALCSAFAGAYVGCLYLFRSKLPRDHPHTIKQRIVSVCCVSAACPLLLYTALGTSESDPNGIRLLSLLGFGRTLAEEARISMWAMRYFLFLFLGPIVQETVDNTWHHRPSPRSAIYLRNFVVAPLTEELVFRCCIHPVMSAAVGGVSAFWVSPLFFGFAHLHHWFEGVPLVVILAQFGYTTVFGWLSTWVFVDTASALAPIMGHAFCNFMGLPDFEGAIKHRHRSVVIPTYLVGVALAWGVWTHGLV